MTEKILCHCAFNHALLSLAALCKVSLWWMSWRLRCSLSSTCKSRPQACIFKL